MIVEIFLRGAAGRKYWWPRAAQISLVSLALLSCCCEPAQAQTARPATLKAVRQGFAHPPEDAKVMMRWWWFGSAVKKDELARELETMKQGGIGGVELQPVYPLELDDPATGFKNLTFLSPEYLDAVRFAATRARALGMRIALTLGSGWPYGGPNVPITDAAGKLRVVTADVPAQSSSIAIPSVRNGEKLLAAFVANGTRENYEDAAWRRLQLPDGARLALPSSNSAQVVAFFIASRTGQIVKRAAAGAEGFVLDHFSKSAVETHLQTVGKPLLRAFGNDPPASVFSDSLEVYGTDWTTDLLTEFRNRRGYDLTPYLPEMVFGHGAAAADLRYDWARTLNELIDENYLATINSWAREHHTHFRSQTYGTPAVTLSSNSIVDLPEGEGSQWHSFSTTRWATSASHIYGRPITSAETWTWLHSPPFRATPLDMKAEADTFFLQGVNQLVGHGWPYSPPSAGDPGWSFYAAAVFNNHNPWWIVMPYITQYLQRMSYLMRQGSPANQVAVLLPEEDAMAHFSPGHTSVSEQMDSLLGENLVAQILDSGYGFDFIDSEAIAKKGIAYPLLVMPAIERLPLAAYRKIEEYVRNGGIVIAVGHAPQMAPGRVADQRDSASVRDLSLRLFDQHLQGAQLLASADALGRTLRQVLPPDVTLTPEIPQVGFIHRKLADSDIYFLANTDNVPHRFRASFQSHEKHVEAWDPFTGKSHSLPDGNALDLNLAPYESRVLVFTDDSTPAAVERRSATSATPIDLATGWTINFSGSHQTMTMPMLRSWTDSPDTLYYSGTAIYTREVNVPASFLGNSRKILLDFGKGRPVEHTQLHQPGMQAWLDAPLRDAALVYINGILAGAVWTSPFNIDVKHLLKPGPNDIRIVVANTAINALSGKARPDYRLLNSRYGERFTPQDEQDIRPQPSGILGPLRLIAMDGSEE